MPYTLGQLKQAVRHAIGGTVDAESSDVLIVNRAKNYVTECFQWMWRITITNPGLDTTSGQSYIILPANWGPIVGVRAQGVWRMSQSTSIDQLLLYRAMLPASTITGYWWAISSAPQTAANVPSLWRMELFPTPTSSEVAAFIACYRRRPPDLVADSDVADMPDLMSDLLMQRCREQAVMDNEQGLGEESEQFQQLLKSAIEEDENMSGPLGDLNGTVSQMDAPGWPFPATISY